MRRFKPTACSSFRRLWSERVLELRVTWSARKRNYIPNIRHAGQKHQQPFEAKSKARVWHASVPAQIRVPPVIGRVEFVERHVLRELIEPLFTLRSTDHFANSRHQHVHRRDRLPKIGRAS